MGKLFIFDFDGTIADTKDLMIDIANTYALEIGESPLSNEDMEVYYDHGVGALIEKRKFGAIDIIKLIKRGSELFSEKSDSVNLIPGIYEAIKEIKDKGFMVSIITSNTEKSVRKIMGEKANVFTGIFGEKDLFGKAAKIKKVIKKFNVDPKNVFYVGDEPRDMTAAIKAQVHPIGVTWGFSSKESLLSSGAEIVIDLPKSLEKLTD